MSIDFAAGKRGLNELRNFTRGLKHRKHPAKAAGGLGRVAVGRCGQAACWAVWLSRAAFQFQGSRAWIWCTG